MSQPQTQGSAGIAILALDLQPEAMCEREKKWREDLKDRLDG